jgi:hypothetical protein
VPWSWDLLYAASNSDATNPAAAEGNSRQIQSSPAHHDNESALAIFVCPIVSYLRQELAVRGLTPDAGKNRQLFEYICYGPLVHSVTDGDFFDRNTLRRW